MIRRLFLLIFFILILSAVAGVYLIGVPYKGFDKEAFIDVPSGTSTTAIARMLQHEGVIRWDWQFLLVRALSSKAKLQAGEYRFAEPASVWTVFNRIARGDVFFYELRVPEGSNQFDIANIIEELGLMPAKDFLACAADPTLVKDLDPHAPTLEGFLFPATYRVTRHTTAKQICRDMTDKFRRTWKEIGKTGASVHDTVTLASLIEKETAQPSERPAVASVFRNRLRIGMTLDCDPTTIYAAMLEARYRGTIHRSDLESMNLYNTYKHAGLPPGPIANPGEASLRAALAPADTDYLYFVAKPGGGSHQFSSNISDHNLAVQAYRRGQAK
jgi:UPF0755 protein